MAFSFDKIQFEEQFKYLNDTKTWLESISINTSNNRFDNIYNLYKIIVEHTKNKSLYRLINEYDNLELWLALSDALSFINIYCAFKDEKSHIYPRAKLKKILKGPYYSWDENMAKGDNESRNILFELETAAFFKKPGFEMIGFDDVDFNFEGRTFNIQCKRLFSVKRIEGNISESARQFTNRMKSQPNIKGIICLCIDKLMAKEQLVLKIKNVEQIKSTLSQLVIEFSSKYRHLWNNILNINILAVFLFFHAIAILEEEPHDLLINCREIEGNIISSDNLTQFSDYHLIKKLADKIELVT